MDNYRDRQATRDELVDSLLIDEDRRSAEAPMLGTRVFITTFTFVLAALGVRSSGQTAVAVFEQVSVVPMDRERVLADRTVIVRDGRIAELGASGAVTVPAGATRIDGRGKFLIPTLAEMHAHVPVEREQAERVLFLYVANGIGTIRSMLGDPSHFALRDRAARGEIVAPTMYLSGPSFNGQTAPTPDAAAARVIEQKKAGYDLLKIHPGVPRDAFDALARTADEQRIRFAGHVPAAVGLARALEAKYSTIDHLDGYIEALAKPGAPAGELFGINLVDQIDESRIRPLVERTKAAGTWMVPTQILIENWYGPEDVNAMRKWPEMQYVGADEAGQWVATKQKNVQAYSPDHRQRYIALRRRLIKALHDGGVGVLLGSDAPQTWNVPGFSIHREIATYVAAGLTPFQALVTGTRAVAEHLGTSESAGTIDVGKRADLVLLDGNPLQEIGNTAKIAGVMVGGRWLPKSDIDKRLHANRAAAITR
jgi:imidazolonepropionase-like amidohydrolase